MAGSSTLSAANQEVAHSPKRGTAKKTVSRFSLRCPTASIFEEFWLAESALRHTHIASYSGSSVWASCYKESGNLAKSNLCPTNSTLQPPPSSLSTHFYCPCPRRVRWSCWPHGPKQLFFPAVKRNAGCSFSLYHQLIISSFYVLSSIPLNLISSPSLVSSSSLSSIAKK